MRFKHVKSWIRLLRLHQWSKNIIILAPLFFSEQWSLDRSVSPLIALTFFCLLCSSAYCLNDLVDASRDASHPQKKMRPIASGAISPPAALFAALLLLLVSLMGIYTYLPHVAPLFLLYISSQMLYTLVVKHIVIADVLFLSLLFLLRLIVGLEAASVAPSTWIIECTWLLALMLIVGKRYVESREVQESSITRPVLDNYPPSYLLDLMNGVGTMALICFLLWCEDIVSQGRFEMRELFPSAIFVAFGVFRYRLLVSRDNFHEDPSQGLLADGPILICFACFVIYLGSLMYILPSGNF